MNQPIVEEPRPERTMMVTAAIVQGIREAILLTEEDISALKSSLLDHLSVQTQQVTFTSIYSAVLVVLNDPSVSIDRRVALALDFY